MVLFGSDLIDAALADAVSPPGRSPNFREIGSVGRAKDFGFEGLEFDSRR